MTTPRRAQIERELDALLAQWATSARLPRREAEAIRLAVLAQASQEKAALGYEWWENLFANLTETVRRATDVRLYLKAVA